MVHRDAKEELAAAPVVADAEAMSMMLPLLPPTVGVPAPLVAVAAVTVCAWVRSSQILASLSLPHVAKTEPNSG